jgi:hypothetical protein
MYRGCIGISGVEPSGSSTRTLFVEVILYLIATGFIAP